MEVTLIGYVLIPLGIFLFFCSTEYLYYILLFFAPFSASAIVNIKSITFGLQIPYYFGILFILKLVISWFNSGNLKVSKTILNLLMPIIVFWLIALMSLIMPIILEQKILVHYPEDPFYFSPLEFKRLHLTQFMYLTFVILFMTFVSIYVNDKKRLYRSLKILLISVIFVCIWGLYQFVGFYLHIPYLHWLFNNNIGYSQGWNQTIFGVVKRVSSVATEPSKLAKYLLWIFPLFSIIYVKTKEKLLSNSVTFFAIFLILLTILLSTSTTGYFGLFFSLSVMSLYLLNLKKMMLRLKIVKSTFLILSKSFIFVLLITVICGIVFLMFFKIDTKTLVDTLQFVTISKLQTQSGFERSTGAFKSLEIFFQSPLLGVGWGSNRSFDLNTTLLSNTGFLGFAFFWFFIYQILKQLYKINSNSHLPLKDRSLSLAFFFSIISGFFAHIVADPDIINLIMWVILGLSISFIRLIKLEKKVHEKDNY